MLLMAEEEKDKEVLRKITLFSPGRQGEEPLPTLRAQCRLVAWAKVSAGSAAQYLPGKLGPQCPTVLPRTLGCSWDGFLTAECYKQLVLTPLHSQGTCSVRPPPSVCFRREHKTCGIHSSCPWPLLGLSCQAQGSSGTWPLLTAHPGGMQGCLTAC